MFRKQWRALRVLAPYFHELRYLRVELRLPNAQFAHVFIRQVMNQEIVDVRYANELLHSALGVRVSGGGAQQIVLTLVRFDKEAARIDRSLQVGSRQDIRCLLYTSDAADE